MSRAADAAHLAVVEREQIVARRAATRPPVTPRRRRQQPHQRQRRHRSCRSRSRRPRPASRPRFDRRTRRRRPPCERCRGGLSDRRPSMSSIASVPEPGTGRVGSRQRSRTASVAGRRCRAGRRRGVLSPSTISAIIDAGDDRRARARAEVVASRRRSSGRRLGVGGCAPSPMKENPASAITLTAT